MMRYLKVTVATIGLVAVGAIESAAAHHAFAAEFDREKPVHMTGTVTEMKWSRDTLPELRSRE